MRLLVYDMFVNVNGIYYVHVCEQARWARSAGNSAIEKLCIIIIISAYCNAEQQTNKQNRTKKELSRSSGWSGLH